MPEYTVSWSIELEAENPEAAAQLALTIHRDPNSLATSFVVQADEDDPGMIVDFGEEGRNVYSLIVNENQLRLLWLGTDTLREANPDDVDARDLDEKVSALIATLPK